MIRRGFLDPKSRKDLIELARDGSAAHRLGRRANAILCIAWTWSTASPRRGLMHRHITHNKCYATFREFSTAMLTFLREEVPKNWHHYCDAVTDNFRVINPTEFRIIA